MTRASGSPRDFRLGYSPNCRLFHDTLLSRMARNQLFDSRSGGMAGDTPIYSKRGVVQVKDLEPGDFVLDQKHGGFVRVVDIVHETSGEDRGGSAVEVPSSALFSHRSITLHPAQPILLNTLPAAKRIFGTDQVMLPALWASPFLGARLRPAALSGLYRPITERAMLIWTVERPIPCLGPDQRWADLQPQHTVSDVELRKWLFLYSFRVEHFFKQLPPGQRHFPVGLAATHPLDDAKESGSAIG